MHTIFCRQYNYIRTNATASKKNVGRHISMRTCLNDKKKHPYLIPVHNTLPRDIGDVHISSTVLMCHYQNLYLQFVA